jgi:CBS domain-containing protein
MQLKDIMTEGVETIPPDSTIADAADTMRNLDIGALPVCDGNRLVGMLTDRDITIRAVAEGRDPNKTRVSACMSPEVLYCFEDQAPEEAEKLMQQKQIRRLPILDRDKNLIGIVALADIATRIDDAEETARTVREISQLAPAH